MRLVVVGLAHGIAMGEVIIFLFSKNTAISGELLCSGHLTCRNTTVGKKRALHCKSPDLSVLLSRLIFTTFQINKSQRPTVRPEAHSLWNFPHFIKCRERWVSPLFRPQSTRICINRVQISSLQYTIENYWSVTSSGLL